MQDAPIDVHLESSAPSTSETASESPRNPVDADAIGPAFGPGSDHVEAALARALDAAAVAGRFDVVAQLARELEARRLARMPEVIVFNAPRSRRDA